MALEGLDLADRGLVAIDRERDLGLDINFRRNVSIKPLRSKPRADKPRTKALLESRVCVIAGMHGRLLNGLVA